MVVFISKYLTIKQFEVGLNANVGILSYLNIFM